MRTSKIALHSDISRPASDKTFCPLIPDRLFTPVAAPIHAGRLLIAVNNAVSRHKALDLFRFVVGYRNGVRQNQHSILIEHAGFDLRGGNNRLTSNGKSQRAALRLLKTYIAREIFKTMREHSWP